MSTHEHIAHHADGSLARPTCATCALIRVGAVTATHAERLILAGAR